MRVVTGSFNEAIRSAFRIPLGDRVVVPYPAERSAPGSFSPWGEGGQRPDEGPLFGQVGSCQRCVDTQCPLGESACQGR